MTRCTLALLGLWLVIPGVRAEPPAIAVKAEAVLRKNCASCHGPGGKSKGGFGYVLDRERLIARQKVVPGKPAESELFERVRLGEMPPKEATLYVAPGAAGVAILKEWIEAGAPSWQTAARRTFIGDDARTGSGMIPNNSGNSS